MTIQKILARLREGSLAWVGAHALLDLANAATSPRAALRRLAQGWRKAQILGPAALAVAPKIPAMLKAVSIAAFLLACAFILGALTHATRLAILPTDSTMVAKLDEQACVRALSALKNSWAPELSALARQARARADNVNFLPPCWRDASGWRLILSTPAGQNASAWIGQPSHQAALTRWLAQAGAPQARIEPAARGPWPAMFLEALGLREPSAATRSIAPKMTQDAGDGLPPFNGLTLTLFGALEMALLWSIAKLATRRKTWGPLVRAWLAHTLLPAFAQQASQPARLAHAAWPWAKKTLLLTLCIPIGALAHAWIIQERAGSEPHVFWAPASPADCSAAQLSRFKAWGASFGDPKAGCRLEHGAWIAMVQPAAGSTSPPSEALAAQDKLFLLSFPRIKPSAWRGAQAPSTLGQSLRAAAQQIGAQELDEASRGLPIGKSPPPFAFGMICWAWLGFMWGGLIFFAATALILILDGIEKGFKCLRLLLDRLRISPAFRARALRREMQGSTPLPAKTSRRRL